MWLGLVRHPILDLYTNKWRDPITTADVDDWTFAENIEDVANRPYWIRFWVVQEFLSAREIHIWCSGNNIDVEDFKHATTCRLSPPTEAYNSNHEASHPPLKAAALLSSRDIDGYPEMKTPLHRLLLRHRACNCQDPRDRVFSLLSLVHHEEKPFLDKFFPDYDLSHDEVAVISVAHCLQHMEFDFSDEPRPKLAELFGALGVKDRSKMHRLLTFAKRFDCIESPSGMRPRLLIGWDHDITNISQPERFSDELEEREHANASPPFAVAVRSSCVKVLPRQLLLGTLITLVTFVIYRRRQV